MDARLMWLPGAHMACGRNRERCTACCAGSSRVCQGAHMGMRAQQGALDGVLRGKQQPHDYLPTLKSEIIDAGLLPNKRTHALLAEYSLQPGKVKEVRWPPTHMHWEGV